MSSILLIVITLLLISVPAKANQICVENEGAFIIDVQWYKADNSMTKTNNGITNPNQSCVDFAQGKYAIIKVHGDLCSADDLYYAEVSGQNCTYRANPSDGDKCKVSGSTGAITFSNSCQMGEW